LIAERAGQGGLTIERMCELSGVSRAGFYRHWEESSPRQADTALRDEMQRVALAGDNGLASRLADLAEPGTRSEYAERQ
jgi:hypothetical protein